MLRTTYYQGLFAIAAMWNMAAAASLLFKPDMLLSQLRIADPAARRLARSFVSSVATWGIGYAMIAIDQHRFRDFAWLGLMSKTIFFVIYAIEYFRGEISLRAFVPAIADLILAAAFAEFLLRTS